MIARSVLAPTAAAERAQQRTETEVDASHSDEYCTVKTAINILLDLSDPKGTTTYTETDYHWACGVWQQAWDTLRLFRRF